MIRSMLSAVSGMRNHQTYLDVIGNNIANINTVGYKASRVLFSDVVSQLVRGASSAQGGRGGVNPSQVGLGMQVAGISTLQTQGTFQATGKITDLAIQGDGFFILNDGSRNLYSRDGSFDVAIDGALVNPNTGMKVQGWMAGPAGAVDTNQPVTGITIPYGETMAGQPSTAVTVKGNLNAQLSGAGTVTQSNTSGGTSTITGTFTVGAKHDYKVAVASVDATTGAVLTANYYLDGVLVGAATPVGSPPTAFTIGATGLSMSIAASANNAVGDTYSFTAEPPIVTPTVSVYDSQGTMHQIKLTFTKTGNNAWTWQAASLDPTVTVAAPAAPTAFTFGSSGTYTGAQPAGTIQLTLTNGAATPANIVLDLSSLSQLAGANDTQATADGAMAGSLTSFAIGQSGEVMGVYSNGHTRLVGQIAMAAFSNPAGLLRAGDNLFETSSNSGDPAIGQPGVGGRGELSAGYLESSNVDLALQFTNMIMAQRGFQANSRVVTASDELLQDLVNLKR